MHRRTPTRQHAAPASSHFTHASQLHESGKRVHMSGHFTEATFRILDTKSSAYSSLLEAEQKERKGLDSPFRAVLAPSLAACDIVASANPLPPSCPLPPLPFPPRNQSRNGQRLRPPRQDLLEEGAQSSYGQSTE